MTEEEAKALKAGDRVLVVATLAGKYKDCEHNYVVNGQFFRAAPDFIHSVLPRPLEVGDRVGVVGVEERLAADEGAIRAIHDGKAWVDWDAGLPSISPLADLVRLP